MHKRTKASPIHHFMPPRKALDNRFRYQPRTQALRQREQSHIPSLLERMGYGKDFNTDRYDTIVQGSWAKRLSCTVLPDGMWKTSYGSCNCRSPQWRPSTADDQQKEKKQAVCCKTKRCRPRRPCASRDKPQTQTCADPTPRYAKASIRHHHKANF